MVLENPEPSTSNPTSETGSPLVIQVLQPALPPAKLLALPFHLHTDNTNTFLLLFFVCLVSLPGV